jgi:hypothetical protein
MKTLMWKEWRENLKWLPLPGLVVLLVFLLDKPDEAMPDTTGALLLCLTAVGFGAALGFVQIFFEAQGDKRSLLLHRPLSRSRIFLAKALAGVGFYLLALGIPFVCLECWLATPGNIPAPYQWRASLPWLADILSGLVYYFAGMLVAQREVRWYASRVLPLAAAFLCSYLVWAMPEFWQALAVIGIMGLFMAVAAWGSFCTAGAYTPQPHWAKAALATTLLAGVLLVSMFVKQMIGEWFGSEIVYIYHIGRQGRVLLAPCRTDAGPVGPWRDARSGQEVADLEEDVTESGLRAALAIMETPLYRSYRNSGEFYVECANDSMPGPEYWFYDHTQERLLGYDKIYHQFLGSFGPDGFTPPGEQPTERFEGALRHRRFRWSGIKQDFLAFPHAVYRVDFARRTIGRFFTPAADEQVAFADWWRDEYEHRKLAVVSTDKGFHFLSEAGTLLVSLPRIYDSREQPYVAVLGLLENPPRYFVWYRTLPYEPSLGPEEYKSRVFHLHEYDGTGRELARRDDQVPAATASYAKALFGLATPLTEAAALVGTAAYLRSEARLQGNTHKPVLLDFLHSIRHYIPGTSRFEHDPGGLMLGYLALMLLAAAASATACFILARRHAFSLVRSIGWAVMGILFGWVGLLLMLALEDWPARTICPKCRKLRVVTRDLCEHCGARHAAPAADGREIFDSAAAAPQVALAANP